VLAKSSYFASDGAAYELFLGRWTKRLSAPVLDFAEFPPEGALLDVGAGTGSMAFAMADRWPSWRILAIDIAEPYVAYAQSQARIAPPIFEAGEAAQLRYDNDTFAGAAAQLVLNFVPQPERAMGEMRRVTRTGGRIAAAVWDFRGGLVYQRLFWDTAAGIDPQAGAARDRLFSAPLALPDALPKLFEEAGLAQIQRSSITIRMDYGGFDDYWQPLLGGQGPVGTYVTNLATGTRQRIEEAVRSAYCSGAPDGPRSMTATAWAVRGTVS
jgi:ubiquinone/menaquinone biosynthesis C-methylase UbiE